jgi:hypothetical protein
MKIKLTMLSIVVTAAALTLSSATAANAATGPGGSVITCNVYADYPHGSGHVAGTINAVGRVVCTAKVDEIYLKTTLLNVTRGTASSTTVDYLNTSSVSTNAAKGCGEGPAVFQTKTDVLVNFPARYTPQQGISHVSSPRITVKCGSVTGANRVASGAPLEVLIATLTATHD